MQLDNTKIGYIYKITSPTNKIYIGQTFNFNKRINRYKSLDCKNQRYLYNSFLKHGYDNHKIEIIESGPYNINELLELEIYYIKYFESFNLGMNLTIGGDGCRLGHHSEETKKKISNSKKNKPKTEKQILAIIKSIGIKHTEDRNKKKSISQGGQNHWAYGKKMKQETLDKKSESMIRKYEDGYLHPRCGIKIDNELREKIKIGKSIPISQYKNDEFIADWESAKEASISLCISHGNINQCCKNKRATAGGFVWKYKN